VTDDSQANGRPERQTEPTPEQLQALKAFAFKYGKQWKSHLAERWLDGRDAQEPDGHLLRQVRNRLGPRWLERYQLQRRNRMSNQAQSIKAEDVISALGFEPHGPITIEDVSDEHAPPWVGAFAYRIIAADSVSWPPGSPIADKPLIVRTQHVRPPIPDRRLDWRATLDDYEPGQPMGEGPTEAAAIAALLTEINERES
jgi:hypothetical protein